MSLVERIRELKGKRIEFIKGAFLKDKETERFHCRHCGEVFESPENPEDVNCPVCGHAHVKPIPVEG